MKKSKKKLYVLGAIALLLCAVIIWQWDNIKAGLIFLQYDKDNISAKIAENDKLIEDSIDKVPEVSLNPLNDDERKQLQEGSLSEQDAMDIILGKNTPSEDPSTAVPSQTPTTAQSEKPSQAPTAVTNSSGSKSAPSAVPTIEQEDHTAEYERIAELIAKVYVMRDSYIALLESIKNAAADEYMALPKDKRTTAKKGELALRCIDKATALEANCDAEINAIVAELTELLIKVGGDTSVASDILMAYADEKALKKAYYLEKYL